MTYRPRRLRKQPLPRFILTTHQRVTREQAADVRREWLAACRRRDVVVVDGTLFSVTQVTR
jgi:hypothetical protein